MVVVCRNLLAEDNSCAKNKWT